MGGAPGLRPFLRGRSSENEQGEEAEGRGRVGGGVPGWQIRFATSRGCQTLIPQPGRPLARSSPSGSIWPSSAPEINLAGEALRATPSSGTLLRRVSGDGDTQHARSVHLQTLEPPA